MLVLTTDKGDSIHFSVNGQEQVTIRVVQIAGNRIRLGFDAGDEVQIDRGSVFENKVKKGQVRRRERGNKD